MADTLLLNADYRPHSLLGWKEAIIMILQDKAHAVEEYKDWEISSPSITIKVPSVLVLNKFVVFRQTPKFNRANIYARDNRQCQYCGRKAGKGKTLSLSDLTFDHVLPRAQGGGTNWENITTACQSCNTKKANRTPKQAKMTLMNIPKKPSSVSNVELELSLKSIPAAWRDYLYWTTEIDQD